MQKIGESSAFTDQFIMKYGCIRGEMTGIRGQYQSRYIRGMRDYRGFFGEWALMGGIKDLKYYFVNQNWRFMK